MSDRDDYAEPGVPPSRWEQPTFRRRAYAYGIVGLSIMAALLAFLAFGVKVRDGRSPTVVSVLRAADLVEACQRYREHHPDRVYPASLAGLTQPLPGGGPGALAEDCDLTDDWGNPFRYALVPNAAGELEPYVWTERTRDGKTTLHGAKVPADGTIIRFGLPDK